MVLVLVVSEHLCLVASGLLCLVASGLSCLVYLKCNSIINYEKLCSFFINVQPEFQSTGYYEHKYWRK